MKQSIRMVLSSAMNILNKKVYTFSSVLTIVRLPLVKELVCGMLPGL